MAKHNETLGQQPQAPPGVPLGRWPADERNEMCLCAAVQLVKRRRSHTPAPAKSRLQPFFAEALSDTLHSGMPNMQRFGNGLIRASLIRQQQNIGSEYPVCLLLSLLHHRQKSLPLFFSQFYLVLLPHTNNLRPQSKSSTAF